MIDLDQHPALYRYEIELRQYPALTDEQYAEVMSHLRSKDPEIHDAALEKLICAHLAMILSMAENSAQFYWMSMEDFVSIGNCALVEKSCNFKPGKVARFSTYMRKVVTRWVIGNIKKHIIWNRADEVELEDWGCQEHYYDELNRFAYLHCAIERLSQFEREILYYSFFDESKPRDRKIAKKLKLPLSLFKQMRKSIYDKLRPELKSKRHEIPIFRELLGESECNLEPEENNERY